MIDVLLILLESLPAVLRCLVFMLVANCAVSWLAIRVTNLCPDMRFGALAAVAADALEESYLS